ncbi:hypothetical protein [Novosphingobium pituita]|uniref:hypothetical protein n=1 Tax=Novosphingobium pituita TaxID=3056842 RepID=UPI00295E8196|nr:hypothetical protein [Novosphingobium sp. IK01]
MANQTLPSVEKLVDLRIAHMNMIQGIITRMSGYSAGVKNFCVTIIVGIIAVAFDKQVPMLIWAALVVVLIFGLMDCYYLALERRYRQLYKNVSGRSLDKASNMSIKADKLDLSTYLTAARSVSVAGFYALLLIGVVVLLTIANHVEPEPAKARSDSPCSSSGASSIRTEQPADVPACPGASRVANGVVSTSGQCTEPAGLPTAAAPGVGRPVRPH